MNSSVRCVMTFVDESTSTWVAVVAVLPCMELHMLLQTVWRDELFTTCGALEIITSRR